ncbi:MAG TPA: hypothetical protein VE422_32530 [Terriglobia bacterium]|nr:hypothetical protein [Terriglobia bacterium]
MSPKFLLSFALLLAVGCSRLDPLTPAILAQAEEKWKAHRPDFYHLVIEMSGDRVETGRFDVTVRGGQVESLRRNGLIIPPGRGQDYSMDGLFRMLEQELGLAEKPAMLGAPAGYSVYPTAQFDETVGALLHYRRSVGGAANTIDIKVQFSATEVRPPG